MRTEKELSDAEKEMADKVVQAYIDSSNGKLKTWAAKRALYILAFERNEEDYIPSIHTLITSVICAMVRKGQLKIIDVKEV